MTLESQEQVEGRSVPGALRRTAEAAGMIGAWMIVGWWLSLDANEYLLAGVPLVLAFQTFVRRVPISWLWVDDGRFTLTRSGWMLATLFAIWPAYELGLGVGREGNVAIDLWLIAAIAGSAAAAYAVAEQWKRGGRGKFLETVFLIAIGCGVFALGATMAGRSPWVPVAAAPFAAGQFLLYFPVSFVLEEVAFRGAIDPHLSRGTTEGGPAWIWALASGALWGLWHLPILPGAGVATAASVIALHAGLGAPLAFLRRTTGTLVFPALAHAAIDAYRNGLQYVAPS